MRAKLFILFYCISEILPLCPTRCICYLDHKDRNVVACKEGGIVGPLHLNNISADTEIIKITPPDDNMNALTMSPVFQTYKHLKEIHITKSNIPQLGMHFFYGLDELDVLNLSQNNITQPLDHNFRGLSHLKELYMDDNRIISLPSGTFRYLHGLKLLSIQRNRIEELTPRIFLEIGKLRVLKLSGNNLRDLNPEVFKDIRELIYLECRSCALDKLNNNIFHLLPELVHLDVGNNKIRNVTSIDLKDLQVLRHLKLDSNLISVIDNLTFIFQPVLKKLCISHNKISRIYAAAFGKNYNLIDLDVGYNYIDNLDFLKPLYGILEKIILSGNHLKMVSLQNLIQFKVLKELKLSDCGIVQIDSEIIPKSVNILDVSENYLSTLQKEILPLNLSSLDISGNRFRGLGEDILLILDYTQSIKLDNNLWSCDLCYIVPMLERVNQSAVFRDVVCTTPHSVKGKKLEKILRNELTWCNSPRYTAHDVNFFSIGEDGKISILVASTSIILLLFTIVAIIGTLFYTNRHAARYYTYEDKIITIESESIFPNIHSPPFCDREMEFKFSKNIINDKKISISTIDIKN